MTRIRILFVGFDPPTGGGEFFLREIDSDHVCAGCADSLVWAKGYARRGAGFVVVEAFKGFDEVLTTKILARAR